MVRRQIRRRTRKQLSTVLLAVAVGLGAAASPATLAAAPVDPEVVRRQISARDFEAVAAYGPEVVPALVELYRRADADERVDIAHTFYRLGWRSQEAKAALMEDVHTSHERLRIAVQYALGRVSDDPEVVDVLLENLQHGFNPLVRDKAACSLAYDQIHLDDAQKARLFRRLIELLESPDKEIRSLAIRVLRVHTGQTKGFIPILPAGHRAQAVARWQRWIEEYEANL